MVVNLREREHMGCAGCALLRDGVREDFET